MGRRTVPASLKVLPSSRRSFVVRLDDARRAESEAEVTAHITRVDDLGAVLDENDVHLGSNVSGIIADLLAQIVREEEDGSGA